MSDNGELLKDACDQVINDPALRAEIDPRTEEVIRTHCNEGALLVAQAMGCDEFNTDGDPLMADQMIELMQTNASGRWKVGTGSEAAIHALGGGLAFAAKTSHELSEAHGHIAAVYPVGMQYSGSLKHDVPLCANVGKQNAEEKVSQAFPPSKGEPSYYLWS